MPIAIFSDTLNSGDIDDIDYDEQSGLVMVEKTMPAATREVEWIYTNQ